MLSKWLVLRWVYSGTAPRLLTEWTSLTCRTSSFWYGCGMRRMRCFWSRRPLGSRIDCGDKRLNISLLIQGRQRAFFLERVAHHDCLPVLRIDAPHLGCRT